MVSEIFRIDLKISPLHSTSTRSAFKALPEDLAMPADQTQLSEFSQTRFIYIPIGNYPYVSKSGLSERQLRKRLVKQGWEVWRGGNIGILRRNDELYPVVREKYSRLCAFIECSFSREMLECLQYLCYHHGMPDFICKRRKDWKFVECKLGHEQLSKRQKLCIKKLQELGFAVEVHKLVEACTKTKISAVDIMTGEKRWIEKELTVGEFA